MLAPLPASQREVIEMLKVAGMSLEEVARATSSTVGSVKQRVHRAYKRLRQHMLAVRGMNGKAGRYHEGSRNRTDIGERRTSGV